jgi:hypothetical protein
MNVFFSTLDLPPELQPYAQSFVTAPEFQRFIAWICVLLQQTKEKDDVYRLHMAIGRVLKFAGESLEEAIKPDLPPRSNGQQTSKGT